MPAPFGIVGLDLLNAANETDPNNTCVDGNHFFMWLFGDCIRPGRDTRILMSDITGVISMGLWVIVGVPQLVKNFCNIQGAGGMSKFLLLFWFLGDSANLTGAILTKQLPAQEYIAGWYVLQDCLLSSQYLYYQYRKWKERKAAEEADAAVRARDREVPVILCLSGFLFLWAFTLPLREPSTTARHISAGRTLLWTDEQEDAPFFKGAADIAGYIIGIASAILYVFSRTTQIRKNRRRRSTEGVSTVMFVMTVLGNLTYGTQILFRSVEGIYILQHLPWLVGSLGIIFLDITILLQSRIYGSTKLDFDILVNEPLLKEEEQAEVNQNYGAIN